MSQNTYLLKELVNKVQKLGDRLHLNREQAQTALENSLLPAIAGAQEADPQSGMADAARGIMIDVLKMLYNSSRWEDRYAAINGSILLISKYYIEDENGQVNTALKDFVWNTIRPEKVPQLMIDPEFRVRNQVGLLLKEMLIHDRVKAAQHFAKLKDLLLANIEETFVRDPAGQDASADVSLIGIVNKTHDKAINDAGKTMHDCEGWKSLETSMRVLQNIIEAVGTQLYDFELDRILNCIIKGVDHINRFVREISYFVLNAIFIASKDILEEGESKQHEETFRKFCDDLIPIVAQGLGDNWSQVRYAASQAARSYYMIAKDDETLREKYDGLMVPRMCLNRYYVAEGVKIYSNETWRLVHGTQGREIISKHAGAVCEFYIAQSTADNHAVREAACHCISELCIKVAREVDKAPFKPFIAPMLSALLDCFKDASWPVRDCACLACAHFVATFPAESESVFPELLELWFSHLCDNIQSVREHSAQAIIEVLKNAEMYQAQLIERIQKVATEDILKAKEQTNQSQKFSGLNNETQFGVAKPNHANAADGDAEHNNGQLYSCGSLAPKLKRGGGCMDHGFSRPKEAWEQSDGVIFLLREASAVESMQAFVVKNLEKLADLAYVDHFKHASTLKENLFKSLPQILKSLGKKQFRGYVETFLDPTFRNAKSEDAQNMAIAAQDFILALEKTYGENIFKAIVEGHDDRYLADLKKYKEHGAQAQHQDFIYPVRNPAAGLPADMVMTKAPWAK